MRSSTDPPVKFADTTDQILGESNRRHATRRIQLSRSLHVGQLHSAVHITPMPDLDDNDDRLRVVDRIENPVTPLTDAKLLLA